MHFLGQVSTQIFTKKKDFTQKSGQKMTAKAPAAECQRVRVRVQHACVLGIWHQ